MDKNKQKEFEAEFKKFKKEARRIVVEVNYPDIKELFENNIWFLKDYPRRKKIYDERNQLISHEA